MPDFPRDCDADRFREKTPWARLTPAERAILTPKLVGTEKGNQIMRADSDAAGDLFNDNFSGANGTESAIIVTGVKNFIDNAGGHSNTEVWQEISCLIGGWSGKNHSAGIAFHVKNRTDFLDVLRRSGEYDVDARYERINLTSDHLHSARFITETSYQPGMHFSQERGYPNTRFDVHWDPRSAAFRNVSLYIRGPLFAVRKNLERAKAGLSHNNPQSSFQTRQELRRMGIVTGEEVLMRDEMKT